MIERLVEWSTRHRTLVLAAAAILCVAGEAARRRLAHDVIPDLSDPQVVLVAEWMGHPATEVADRITAVLTRALDGVPGSSSVRGGSMAGMAYVEVVFPSRSRAEAGREAILERVRDTRPILPPAARVLVGPRASSTGWVLQYLLLDPTHADSPLTLRRFQDDVLRPAVASLPGVAEVASVGGEVREAVVDVLSESLRARRLAFSDVAEALRFRFASAPPPTAAELEDLALPAGRPGESVRLREVARLRDGHEMPRGFADFGGLLPGIGGIVIAQPGTDVPRLAGEVRRTLESLRARLRGDVQLVAVYDRGDLARRVEGTLMRALAEEVAVVGLAILIFLVHARTALVPLVTLPLVVLLTLTGMWLLGIPATVMSLGGIGIALGVAVDADVVALEACHRRLEPGAPVLPGEDRRARIVAAAASVTPAIVTSLLITALSFLPVLAFSGEAGRLLRPLALSKTLVIAAAILVSLTVGPSLRGWLLPEQVKPEFGNPLMRGLVRVYRPFVEFALNRPAFTLITAALIVLSCAPIVPRLGAEFLPRIDEGDLLFMPSTAPGAPANAAFAQLRLQDRAIASVPEVATVFGKLGRADTATDPAPLSMAETTIRLRPREEWPAHFRARWYSGWAPKGLRQLLGLVWPEEARASHAELIDRLDLAARLPGWTSAWTAPIRARMDMTSTGVRTPIGIRVVGRDPARLEALMNDLRLLAGRLPGTRSAASESLGGEMWLDFTADSAAIRRSGVDPAVLGRTADLVRAGGQIGEMELDGRPVRVRLVEDLNVRGPADQLRAATVRGEGGAGPPIPLALLGRVAFSSTPAAVRTERGELAAYVHVDLQEGIDLLGFVEQAKREVAKAVENGQLRLGPGERIEWAGQYALLAAGAKRFRWIAAGVVLSMLILLFMLFRNLTEALLVLASVPFALAGSCWTLFLLGYPLSAPVWVGLLAVLGLAMQTGVVMVVYIDEAFHRRVREGRLRSREDIVAAHAEGTVLRLRPKIMTVTTMAAALLPLLWSDGAGAEIMKRVAAPMIGGLATSAFLTLEVLPVLYTIWRHAQLRKAQRAGAGIEAVVGRAPRWARAENSTDVWTPRR